MKINFTEVKPLFYWVQHILPLVYDDSLSYMELLGRVTKRLNELIENNNNLPDYIMELIKEYISSGEIEKVLAEVLANYMLNVKFPPAGLTPATGNGSADDTEAIQGCINYAYQNGGMAVYFPSGAYLTQPLTLNEKVTLFGQDRYTTRIVMKGGATKPLFTGTVDEMSLTGLGFDGNMDIQVNNVNLFTITVNSAIITNCLLTDGYDLLNITVNNELQLDNILFRHAVENALVVGGAGYVQGANLIFKSLSTLIGKNYVVLNTNKSILEEVKCFGAAPNGVLIGGNSNVINMWCEACQTPYVDNGTNNTVHVYSVMEDEKFTGNVTQYIGGSLTQTVVAGKTLATGNVKDTANGTREESTTGNKTETVNGNDTETVGGDKKETVSGSKSVIVTLSLDENIGTNKISVIKGTNTETITGLSTENANGGKALISTDYNENVINRNITAAKIEETLTGNKTVTAANITETVDGYKTVKAGDISNTAANITNHATQDLTEQVDGDRNLTVTGANNETTGARTETVNGKKTENYTELEVLVTNGEQHNGKQMSILTDKPLKYGSPEDDNGKSEFFKYLRMIDKDDNEYYILVENNNTSLLKKSNINVLEYGFKNDGLTDNSEALNNIYTIFGENINFIFPSGNYLFNSPVILKSGCTFIGLGLVNSKLICNAGIALEGLYTSIKNIHIDLSNADIGIKCEASFSLFDNLWLENGTTALLIKSNNVIVNNCFINGNVNGIEVSSGALNTNIANSFVFSTSIGLLISQNGNRVEGLNLINTIIAFANTCIAINGGILLFNLTNCILDQYNNYGILAQASNIDGINLTSCYIGAKLTDFDSIAILISSLLMNFSLNNCYIATNKLAGLFVTEHGKNSENIKIANCTFRDNTTDIHIDACKGTVIALNSLLSATSVVVLNNSTGIVIANKYVAKSIVESVVDQFNFN